LDQIILSDMNQFPSEKIIFSNLGESLIMWQSLFSFIHTTYPDFSEEWRYYNDGKSWLMKVTRKSKTIFWLSVIPDSFRITFYFGGKAEPAIMESTLPDKIKEQFKEGKRFGKIRGITLVMNKKQNIKFAKELISIKLSSK